MHRIASWRQYLLGVTVAVVLVTVATAVHREPLVTVLVVIDVVPGATHEQNPVKRLEAIPTIPGQDLGQRHVSEGASHTPRRVATTLQRVENDTAKGRAMIR